MKRIRGMMKCFALGCALFAYSAISRPALAQGEVNLGNIALNKYEPSPAGDLFLAVPSPFVGGHLVLNIRAALNIANNPLVLQGGDEPAALVKSQGVLHAGLSFALRDLWVLSADFPMVVFQGGQNPIAEGKTLSSPSGAAAGDLRLGARVRLWGEEESLFQAAAGVYLHLPTGSENKFASDGAFRDWPYVSVGGKYRMMFWSASFGSMISGSRTNASTLNYSLALGTKLNMGLVSAIEFYAATPLPSGNSRLNEFQALSRTSSTNAELLFNLRYFFVRNMALGAATGLGIGDAIGTPSLRFLASLSVHLDQIAKKSVQVGDPKRDDDNDGIENAKDACSDVRGLANKDAHRHGCPVWDVDKDGVWDADDACPEEPGGEQGCP